MTQEKSPEDEAFDAITQNQMKRATGVDEDDDTQAYVQPLNLNPYRNTVLEEVAVEFDKMRAFGDTAASFAVFVRAMKN